MEKELDYQQSIMDKAYEIWNNNKSMSYSEFIQQLNRKQQLAVLTGNLNYQVGNGGFYQWHDNNYSSESDKLLAFLNTYNTIPVVAEVEKLVIEVIDIIAGAESDIEEARSASEWGESYEEEEYIAKQLIDDLDKYDDKYYELSEKFLEVIESILQKMDN